MRPFTFLCLLLSILLLGTTAGSVRAGAESPLFLADSQFGDLRSTIFTVDPATGVGSFTQASIVTNAQGIADATLTTSASPTVNMFTVTVTANVDSQALQASDQRSFAP